MVKKSAKICLFVDKHLFLSPQAQHIYNSNIYKAMENHTENINQGRPVYFSYASNSSEMQTTQPQTRTAQFKNVFLIGIVFLIYSLTSCSSTTNNKVDNVADSDIANNVKVADTSIEGESEILSKAYDLYDEGKYSDAIGCLENLANKGSVRAQFCIGNCYDKMSDYKKANEWYQRSADQGYEEATEALNKLKQKEANHTRRLDW